MIEVRAATLEDADDIASINVRAWRASYRGIMPDVHLDALNQAGISSHVRDVILRANSTVLVAACPTVQAYAWMAQSRDTDAKPQTAELIALYVAPTFERRGLGRNLTTQCCELAREQGFERVTLWMLAQNHRAGAFYEAMGFALDGHDKTTVRWGGTPLRQVRFVQLLRD